VARISENTTEGRNQSMSPELKKSKFQLELEASLKLEKEKEAQALTRRQELKKNQPTYLAVEDVPEHIRIIFDDSSSMYGQSIEDAKAGTIEFMRYCQLNQVAVEINFLNEHSNYTIPLSTNLPSVANEVKKVYSRGNTPLIQVWDKILKSDSLNKSKKNRIIMFTDGEANYYSPEQKEFCIQACIEEKITCDTVYITNSPINKEFPAPAYELLKEIADRTGGIFLVFDRNKVNFSTAFKYLTPGKRLLLVGDVTMQRALEEGSLK
jgi:Mg-chelatase subunit ChlD